MSCICSYAETDFRLLHEYCAAAAHKFTNTSFYSKRAVQRAEINGNT